MSVTIFETSTTRQRSPWEKRARLLHAYLAGRPVWCAWQVTYRCNLRCSFCNYWQTPSDPESELTVDQFALGARKLAQRGSMLISLGGGEPLLRRDIVDIVRELARYHFVFMTTNGWLVTPELARRLFQAGLWGASVSLDYADSDLHDRGRGRTGAYDRAVSALRAFVEARRAPYQRVNVMSVLLHDNPDHMGRLARLAMKVGATFMVQPYSPVKTGSRDFLPTGRRGVSRRLLDLHRTHPNFLSHRRFLARFDEALDGGVPGCRAGKSFFNIDEQGQVALCVERRSQPVGDLVRDDFRVIQSRLRRAARGNRCQACWYNCRGEVECLYSLRGVLDALPTYLLGPEAEAALRRRSGHSERGPGASGGTQGRRSCKRETGQSARGRTGEQRDSSATCSPDHVISRSAAEPPGKVGDAD